MNPGKWIKISDEDLKEEIRVRYAHISAINVTETDPV
jgi:hypothetical protein